jgi:hypothetical protein
MQVRVKHKPHRAAKLLVWLLGLPRRLFPKDFVGWADDTITKMGVHSTTHIDAPWHYGPLSGGAPAPTIEEIPLEKCIGPGVVLDLTHKEDDDPITPADMQAERRELLDWAAMSGRIPELTRLADAMPIPERKPAFENLIVDSDGFLWAKEYSSYTAAPVRYRIFGPDGRRVGVAWIPGRVRVFDIGADYVLGVLGDTEYVETIVMYELVRPEVAS